MSRTSHRRRTFAALTATALGASLALVPAGATATTSTVCAVSNPSIPATYSDFQDALDAALNGHTLLVTGICYGNFYTDGILLTIVGGILDGSQDPGEPVLTLRDGDSTDVTIRKTIIRNGDNYAGYLDPSESGGGIRVEENADLTLVDVTVMNNKSSGDGGGIFLQGNEEGSDFNGTGTSLVMTGGKVTGNQSADDGGGIGTSRDNTDITMSKVYVRNNKAGDDGGGISVEAWSAVYLASVTIESNRADDDGGGFEAGEDNVMTMLATKITKNVADSQGGGIFTDLSLTRLASGSTVAYNRSVGDGGGVGIEDESLLILEGTSSVRKNVSGEHGGGIYAVGDSTVRLLDRSKVEYNSADEDGGGVYHGNGTLTMSGLSRILRNRANVAAGGDTGGGVWADGCDVTLNNVIAGTNVLYNTPDNVDLIPC